MREGACLPAKGDHKHSRWFAFHDGSDRIWNQVTHAEIAAQLLIARREGPLNTKPIERGTRARDSGIATRRIKPDPDVQAIPIIVVPAYALTGEESESGLVVMTKYLCSMSVVLSRGTGQ